MTKTYYVDWIKGSNNGEGSKIFPFQTMRSALDNIICPIDVELIICVANNRPVWFIRLILRIKQIWNNWRWRWQRNDKLVFRSYG